MQQSNHFDWKRQGTKLEKLNNKKGKQRRDNVIQKNFGIATTVSDGSVKMIALGVAAWYPCKLSEP
jgi:hypothetical protein